MLSGLSRRNKIIFVVVVLTITVVGTITTFFEGNTFIEPRIVDAFNGVVILLLGLIQAVPALKDILNTQPITDEEVTNALSELAQAETFLKHNDYLNAKKSVERVIKILPNKAEAYRIRAKANFALGQYVSAIEDYSKAIQLQPGYPYTYSDRAMAYQTIGETAKSIDDWQMGIKIAPEVSSQLFQLALAYFYIGAFAKAKDFFDQVINHPRTSDNDKSSAREFNNRIQNILM